MGILSNLFGKLLKRKKILALPEADQDESSIQASKSNKHLNFVREMREQVEIRSNDENEASNLINQIKYNAKNFKEYDKWNQWYNTLEDRNEYYSEHIDFGDNRGTYKGALAVIPVDTNVKKIVCNIIDDDTKKPEKIELGQIKGRDYRYAMYEIDSILSLQSSGAYKGEQLSNEIQRHFDKLKKMKNLNLTVIGEEVLKATGEEVIVLQDLEEEELYGQRVDFTDLKTKATITQMPVECIQADVSEHSLEEIDQKVEEFYRYCELAVDIGVPEEISWKHVDRANSYINKGSTDENSKYNREPNYKNDCYEEIKKKYLTKGQTQVLKKQDPEGMQRNTHKERTRVKEMVQNTMDTLPLKLEEFIIAYEVMHKDDPRYSHKISLLKDFEVHSKLSFLKGLNLEKNNQHRDIGTGEPELI